MNDNMNDCLVESLHTLVCIVQSICMITKMQPKAWDRNATCFLKKNAKKKKVQWDGLIEYFSPTSDVLCKRCFLMFYMFFRQK